MARPKKDPKAPNPGIDKMIDVMRRKFPELPPDVQINLIKTAILWESAKHRIKDDDEGSFFNEEEDKDAGD